MMDGHGINVWVDGKDAMMKKMVVTAFALSVLTATAELRGPFPVLLAPYGENGELDLTTLVKEARFVVDAGVGGFIWCQSRDSVDLLSLSEKKASFAALAAAFAGEDAVVALGCEGRDAAEMEALAGEVERLAIAHPTTHLAVACRPPHDARTQDDLERYYRAFAKTAKRPAVIQTCASDGAPAPAPEMLGRLSRAFPNVYGWLDKYRHCGTRGMVPARAPYADYMMAVWEAIETGDVARADELRAKYLLTMNLKEALPDGALGGFDLYILRKRGVFRNCLSRGYVNKVKTPGKWKLVDRAFTPDEAAEIENCWRRMAEMIPERTFVSRIRVLPGERWYGAATNLGRYQPWTEKSETSDVDYNKPDYDLSLGCWGGGVMPFLVSDRGRYVWSDGPFRFRFTGGTLRIVSHVEKVAATAVGKTLREAYLAGASRHFPFSGKVPPAAFFAKPQFNNWIEIFLHGINQEVSEKYVRDLAASGFPCGVFMTDGGWMKYHGAELFDEIRFPDPVRYFDLIRAQGWKSLVWMSPFVSPDSQREYRRLRYNPQKGLPGSGYEKGLDYLIAESDSRRPAILRWWSGNSAAYDLTNPAAFEYYVARLRKFAADYHFDGFKFDAGNPEFIPDNYRFFKPGPRSEFGRAYTLVGTHIPYNEFRSGFGTGGQAIVQRLHDQSHTWKAQGEIVKNMICAGLIGYPYVVADMIGGGACGSFFPGKPFSPKLMVRSCELQALMPMMQFSVAPWRVLGRKDCETCRDYAKLHCEFAPYILTWAEHAARTGEPILRSMEYEFPGQGFEDCFTQFMLGPDWLVAPVIVENDAVVVRLPVGMWTDDLGKSHVGPKTLELRDVPLTRLPRYRRADGSRTK